MVAIITLSASLMACGAQQEQSGRAHTRTPRRSHDTRPPAALDGRISPLLSANFVLLRTPPNGVPFTVRQALGSVPGGVNGHLARRIPVSLPSKYWLVPGVATICVVATTPRSPSVGTVCASVSQALHHGIANTSVDFISGKRVIVGVVPTGTHTVLVRSGATTSSVRALHGRFVLRDSIAAPPDEFTLR